MASNSSSAPLFSFSPSQVPIFEGEHYEYWSSQMQTFFESMELWDVIDGELQPPTENDENFAKLQKDYKKKDATALRYIQQDVGRSIFPRIFGIKTVIEAWKILKLEFQGTERTIALKLQLLWRDFDNLKMEEQESIRDFSSRVSEIVNQIKSCGDTIQEKRVVEKVLRCLPLKFDHATATIEESKDLSKITMYELTGSLLAHEQRINRSVNPSTEQAFQSKHVPKSNFGNKGEFKGSQSQNKGKWRQNEKRSNWKSKQPQNSGNNSGCHICKKTNHESKDCFFRCKRCKIPNHSQRDCWFQNKEKSEGKDEAKFTNEELLFYSSDNRASQNVWYLESGCSNHMMENRDIFEKLDPNVTSQIILGDSSQRSAKEKGTIAIHTKEGNKKLITDVLYVPNLSHNLLSVGQLIQKELGYGKMHKLLFPKTSWRASAPLELVHSDICGPMQTPTPRNKRYFILFTDDYTRHMWIYFLNQKSEAFSTFLKFKAQAERESGFLIKTLRTDRGGEFLHNSFLDYCKENGKKTIDSKLHSSAKWCS
ncbi:UNVERIFIED_CONTAM: hypothetical protein Sradi_4412900 [Sesamum radiatum]|uniref:Integrase catalytic domain-containing protein n=1 Tax=Sesamum radiatum TaxID=300843 RepID=A0AAW2NTK3_SESRA